MNRNFASLVLVCAAFLLGLQPASAVPIIIPTVHVGNPGNANDPSDGDISTPGIQNFGSVAYDYRIGTTEVTNAQYAAFLSEKAKADPLNLYDANMGSDARGGILQIGTSGSFTYALKANMANKPVNNVNWYDAIRFANWLNNGQGSGDTETGAYTLGALGPDGIPIFGSSITRNVGAKWFLPSENEWYKAAYHQPAAQGGDVDDYWLYPTRSNSDPTMATAINAFGPTRGDIANPGSNVANFGGGADWNGQDGNVTTVGSAGPGSESFYGTSDQGGNVWEWNETFYGPSSRGVQGGSAVGPRGILGIVNATKAVEAQPNFSVLSPPEFPTILWTGFRVAAVPEPSTAVLTMFACGLMWVLRKRFK